MEEAMQWIVDALERMGLWGILFGLVIEVIPSEIVLSYGGYLVSQGQISFWSAVWVGVAGGTIAQLIMYGLGKYGGRPFLEKYGKYMLVKQKHLDMAETWFERYGTGVVFTARFIPVVRHAISIPAGIAGMPIVRFTLLTALAVIPWSVGFVWLGMTLGGQWQSIDEAAERYTLPAVIAAIAMTAGYIAYVRWKSKRPDMHASGKEAAEEKQDSGGLGLGQEYMVHSGLLFPVHGREEQLDYVAVGPNGVFYVMMTPPASPERFAACGYALRKLVRAHRLEASVRGVWVNAAVGEETPKLPALTVPLGRLVPAIRSQTARRPLDRDAVRRLAEAIAAHAAK